jgi:competence protein ComGC
MKLTHHNLGFSLVELALVLVIISLFIGVNFSLITSKTSEAKVTQTKRKMVIIEEALAGYAALYNKLPCPAPLTEAEDAANFGKAQPSCTQIDPKAICTIGGAIPFQALSLPRDFTYDGFGNRFIYTTTCSMTAAPLQDSAVGLIKVEKFKDPAAYSLMSVGANQYGGWNKYGNRAQIPPDNDELTNYNLNTDLSKAGTKAYKEMAFTKSFDDIINYKMKFQLVREAGGIVSDKSCTIARDVFDHDSSVCDHNCYSSLLVLATQVNDWCLNKFR